MVWCLDLDRPNRLWQRLLRTHLGDTQVTLESLVRVDNRPAWAGFAQRQKTSWYYQRAISLLESAEIQ